MAQQGSQSRVFFDPVLGLRHYHDPRSNEYGRLEGTSLPYSGPSTTLNPRTGGPSSGSPRFLRSPEIHPGSPSRETNHAHGQSAQPYLPQGLSRVAGSGTGPNPTIDDTTVGKPSSRMYDAGGIQIVEARDAQSGIRTTFGTSPARLITDPMLYNAGVRATRIMYGTGKEETEQLYSNYRTRNREFFCFGRVFMMLWVESAGESGSVITDVVPSDQAFSTGAFKGRVFSKVRRFVVIREGETYCSALPIATYGQRGVSKPGIKKSEHAIIYTSKDPPPARTDENPQRGEAGMRPIAIRVVPDELVERLDPMSRIDFGKVHTIQHNVKVRPFGMVHAKSRSALYTQFQNVWSKSAPTPLVSRRAVTGQAVRGPTGASATNNGAASENGSRRNSSVVESGSEKSLESEEADQEDENDAVDDDDEEDEVYDDPSSLHGDWDQLESIEPQPAHVASGPLVMRSSEWAAASSKSKEIELKAKIQQARGTAMRLIQMGYSKEDTLAQLEAHFPKQGETATAAFAELRAMLSGNGTLIEHT